MITTPKLVDPGAIQKELDRIWESLETTSTTRACLFNLICYNQRNERTEYIQKLAQAVIEKFPSRVMLITLDDSLPADTLTTQVSILSSSQGEYDVACDLIQIEASTTSQDKIPFIILPHILPDLPVYLVLAEDPSKTDPLASALEKWAQRLIFDSETTTDLGRFAASALEHQALTHADIADLNWARIESWREMLSSTFHSKERVEQLSQAQTIEITYNAHPSSYFCHTHIQAIYLQAWLATQLQWEFQSMISTGADKTLIRYLNQEVWLNPVSDEQLSPGLILSMTLTTTDHTLFTFQRDLQAIHQIAFHLSTPTQCLLPSKYIFPKAEVGHSLVKEICHRGTSQHFLNSLALIQRMDIKQCL